jgi:hypothetical protein
MFTMMMPWVRLSGTIAPLATKRYSIVAIIAERNEIGQTFTTLQRGTIALDALSAIISLVPNAVELLGVVIVIAAPTAILIAAIATMRRLHNALVVAILTDMTI